MIYHCRGGLSDRCGEVRVYDVLRPRIGGSKAVEWKRRRDVDREFAQGDLGGKENRLFSVNLNKSLGHPPGGVARNGKIGLFRPEEIR